MTTGLSAQEGPARPRPAPRPGRLPGGHHARSGVPGTPATRHTSIVNGPGGPEPNVTMTRPPPDGQYWQEGRARGPRHRGRGQHSEARPRRLRLPLSSVSATSRSPRRPRRGAAFRPPRPWAPSCPVAARAAGRRSVFSVAVVTSSTSPKPRSASQSTTSITRSSGTLAPEVRPTVLAPSSHSSSISLAKSTR